jgi:hypothetical protein
MKNIYILPTEQFNPLGQQIWIRKNGGYFKPTKANPIANNLEGKANIYITSDEEIKEGHYGLIGNEVMSYHQMHKKWGMPQGLKIILTTDQDLIKDGVQKLSDEFLECFVNNPSCEFVEVLFACRGLDGNTPIGEYRIIIPKEELHSMDDEVECNMCGGYMYLLPDNSIYVCTNSECTRCYEEEDEEPKQETLEEAMNNNGYHDQSRDALWREGVNFGVKWQQEQDKNKYSEEDMMFAYEQGARLALISQSPLALHKGEFPTPKEWFEQFKNK